MKNVLKRAVAMMLILVMVAGCLTGCGNKTENVETSAQPQPEAAPAPTPEAAPETGVVGETAAKHPVTTDPITISILTQRQDGTNNADEIWFFQYLEYWLKENYGYNVTIDIQQAAEPEDQISLLLGTDSLPDLVWAITLNPNNTVIYGDEQGMLLDWTPYLNEEYMPNLYYELTTNHPDALQASTSADGKIYSIPHLNTQEYGEVTSTFGIHRLYVNQDWLDQCNLEMPTNLDEFLNMLRTFKNEVKPENGQPVIPLISNGDILERSLWIMLGHYGNDMMDKYGRIPTIKNGEVQLGAYSEDYRTFVEVMHTMYEEGLISSEHLTMDATTARGLYKSGVAGVACDWTLSQMEDYLKWNSMPTFPIGDAEISVITPTPTYGAGSIWASAETEYPEVLALIVDYVYSAEGATMYKYGPMEGQDPLGMVDGWYMSDDNLVTTKLIEDGTYNSWDRYAYQYIRSHDCCAA